MKKLIISLALAAVVALGFTGCATTSGNSSGTNSPAITQAQLDKTAILLKGTVRASLVLLVQKNGTNAQAYVCAAADVLSVTLGSTNYTPGALETRLAKLPVKELKKAEVQLAISVLLTTYEIYYADYVAGKVNGNAVATTLLTAIRDGAAGACSFSEGGGSSP
jgi:hypothetical protein